MQLRGEAHNRDFGLWKAEAVRGELSKVCDAAEVFSDVSALLGEDLYQQVGALVTLRPGSGGFVLVHPLVGYAEGLLGGLGLAGDQRAAV